jgi:hypothetical protein
MKTIKVTLDEKILEALVGVSQMAQAAYAHKLAQKISLKERARLEKGLSEANDAYFFTQKLLAQLDNKEG